MFRRTHLNDCGRFRVIDCYRKLGHLLWGCWSFAKPILCAGRDNSSTSRVSDDAFFLLIFVPSRAKPSSPFVLWLCCSEKSNSMNFVFVLYGIMVGIYEKDTLLGFVFWKAMGLLWVQRVFNIIVGFCWFLLTIPPLQILLKSHLRFNMSILCLGSQFSWLSRVSFYIYLP